jgi:hypothetical protein
MRGTLRANFEKLDRASQYLYLAGIGLPLASLILLGLWGWEGALKIGNLPVALVGALLSGVVIWFAPRVRALSPPSAHWVRPTAISWMDWFFRGLWGLYRSIGRLSNGFSTILEGEGGFMWTLLFMVLFISLIMQGNPGP